MLSYKQILAMALSTVLLCSSGLLSASPHSVKRQLPIDTMASPCGDIDWNQSPPGVRQFHARQQFTTEHCLVLKPGMVDDYAPVLNRLPSDTTVYFSGQTSDSLTPTVVVYPVSSTVTIKHRQHFHAVPEQNNQIIRLMYRDFSGGPMIHLGDPLEFDINQSDMSVISGFHFTGAREDTDNSIDTFIYVQCNNQTLRIANNVFHLDSHASVHLNCTLPNSDANQTLTTHYGPSLEFISNRVIGSSYQLSGKSYIPSAGIHINTPLVTDLKERILISGNTFTGIMSKGIEIALGKNSSAILIENTIDIATAGNVSISNQIQRGGVVLQGRSNVQPSRMPVFEMAANRIHVPETAIILEKSLMLEFSCNALQGDFPWSQVAHNEEAAHYEKFHAFSTEKYLQLCSRKNVTDGSTRNLWNTNESSTQKSPCEGLQQYSGIIPFTTSNCIGSLKEPLTESIQAENGTVTTVLIISIMVMTTVLSTIGNLGLL